MQQSISKFFTRVDNNKGKEKEKPPPPKRKVAADEVSPKDVESKKKKVQEPVVIDLETEESNQSQPGRPSFKDQPRKANMDFEPDPERQKNFVRKLKKAFEDEGGTDNKSATFGTKIMSNVKYTAFEQQVVSLKKKHPDILLLIECGYRFRFFGDDALVAAKVLGIFAHIDHNFYVASIPTVRCKVHVRRLVEAGYKVGIVRQTETAALKAAGLTQGGKSKMFERKLMGVFTNATFDEDDPALSFANVTSGGGATNGKQRGPQNTISFGGSSALKEAEDSDEENEAEGGKDESSESVAAEFDVKGETNREQWIMCIHEEKIEDHGEEKEPTALSLALERREAGREVDQVRFGIVAVDARTGLILYDNFTDMQQRLELDTRLHQLQPLELLLPYPSLSKQSEACIDKYIGSAADSLGRPRTTRIERCKVDHFMFERAVKSVSDHFQSLEKSEGKGGHLAPEAVRQMMEVQNLPRSCISALGPLINHVETFGIERILSHPLVRPFSSAIAMTLDGVTLRDLEIFSTQSDKKEQGSLFWLMDHTSTPFGNRRLRDWLRKPLLKREDILARQEVVEELAFSLPTCLASLVDRLKKLPDLDAIISSLHYHRVNPRRLVLLLQNMLDVMNVLPDTETCKAEITSLMLLQELQSIPLRLKSSVVGFLDIIDFEQAKNEVKSAIFLDPNFFPELTKIKEAMNDVELEMQEELQNIRKLLRKPSLEFKTIRTGVNSSLEYLIELRRSEIKTVPKDWVQVSQTKEVMRFHPPKVTKLFQTMLCQREELQIAGEKAWQHFVMLVDQDCYSGFRSLLGMLSNLDAFLALAKLAKMPGYVKPDYPLDEGKEIVIKDGRHPVLERIFETDSYVPNDVSLGYQHGADSCLIVTGPNMGGKSSYVRMVSLIVIMGQLGSFVPASSAKLRVVDGVYTRMGAGDDLASGMSTFLVELWNTSSILSKATSRSLIILDELGRGTSTHDGVAIAEATVRYIVKTLGSATLFVTHYPQLADLCKDEELKEPETGKLRVRSGHMSFVTNEGEGTSEEDFGVVFLYKLVESESQRCYGLNVARMAGLDSALIEMAAKKSKELREKCEDIRAHYAAEGKTLS